MSLLKSSRLQAPASTCDHSPDNTRSTPGCEDSPLRPGVNLHSQFEAHRPKDAQHSDAANDSPKSAFGNEADDLQLFGSGDFNDYLVFLDNSSFPNQSYSSVSQYEQPLPSFSPDPIFFMPDLESQTLPNQRATADNVPAARLEQSSFSRFGSRLPSLQPEEASDPVEAVHPPSSRRNSFSEVSVDQRSVLSSRMDEFHHVVPRNFVLPTRHAISRYLAGYVTGFHEHLPFLHIPTISVATTSADLILAVAAVGAQYCREPEKSVQIFHVAYAVAIDCSQRRDRRASAKHAPMRRQSRANCVQTPVTIGSDQDTLTDVPGTPMETVQALLLLMAMATWFEEKTIARAAMTIRSQLESLVRDQGLGVEALADDPTWEEWISYEGNKRAKFIAYCFLNLHSIVFDMPPLILNRDLAMTLPCSEPYWKAASPEIWSALWQTRKTETTFQEAFANLFKDQSLQLGDHTNSVSTLGGYVLIHALVQHIWFTQQIARYHPDPIGVSTLEKALKSWQTSWSRNPESSVDPLNPHGPVSFNSSALLRIAYIRINVDTGPIRSLRSWDPLQIATSIRRSAPVARSKRMTRAALHCAHALSIPIKLGIDFVAHTQMFFWSTQHALCSLECALLLTKWLESVTALGLSEPALAPEEKRLLNFVAQMVEETEYSVATGDQDDVSGKHLSAAVVRLWAKLFRSDTIWPMIDVIGRSLDTYAGMMEAS